MVEPDKRHNFSLPTAGWSEAKGCVWQVHLLSAKECNSYLLPFLLFFLNSFSLTCLDFFKKLFCICWFSVPRDIWLRSVTSEAPCYPATLGPRVKWSSAAAFWAILDTGHLRRWSHPSLSLPLISCLEIMPTSENIIMVQKTVYFTLWKITHILCGDTANLQKHENGTKPVCVTC